jgi:hypothetical protein
VLERLDKVTVSLHSRDVELEWSTREALLAEMKHYASTHGIRDAFEAVGATRPVTLTVEQKIDLVQVIERWANETTGAYGSLPVSIFRLRNALHDDLHHAEQQ